ncbi:UvrD-helicase domain-containing protein [Priestia megaterium]
MLSQISLWKSDGIMPGEAASLNHGKRDLADMANVYQMYEDEKIKHNYFDYDDLLVQTVRLFRTNPEVLGRYQNLFRYVLVDEYQDTNKIQFELIEMLTAQHGNLFLVGDADQSIYSFRSAKIENILSYQKLHPDTRVILLKQNYRSTQKLLMLLIHWLVKTK